jgi:hypothetical protein
MTYYLLKNGNREGRGLAGTRLSLCDDVMALDAGDDGALLDGRGLLETVGVDTAKEFFPQRHIVEVLADLLPVGVDQTFGVHACGSVVTGSLAGSGAGTVGRPGWFVAASMRSRRSETSY